MCCCSETSSTETAPPPRQVSKARRKFAALVEGGGLAGRADGSLPWDALLRGVMGDAELAPPAELPRTGVAPEAEHKMSAAFVAPWDHPVCPRMVLCCPERLQSSTVNFFVAEVLQLLLAHPAEPPDTGVSLRGRAQDERGPLWRPGTTRCALAGSCAVQSVNSRLVSHAEGTHVSTRGMALLSGCFCWRKGAGQCWPGPDTVGKRASAVPY